jgi:hypothetical protein
VVTERLMESNSGIQDIEISVTSWQEFNRPERMTFFSHSAVLTVEISGDNSH